MHSSNPEDTNPLSNNIFSPLNFASPHQFQPNVQNAGTIAGGIHVNAFPPSTTMANTLNPAVDPFQGLSSTHDTQQPIVSNNLGQFIPTPIIHTIISQASGHLLQTLGNPAYCSLLQQLQAYQQLVAAQSTQLSAAASFNPQSMFGGFGAATGIPHLTHLPLSGAQPSFSPPTNLPVNMAIMKQSEAAEDTDKPLPCPSRERKKIGDPVLFWTAKEWSTYKKTQEELRLSVAPRSFLQNTDGTSISEDDDKALLSQFRVLFTTFAVTRVGAGQEPASSYTNLTHTELNHIRIALYPKFPFLRLCFHDWKVQAVGIEQYPNWKKKRSTSLKRGREDSPSLSRESSLEPSTYKAPRLETPSPLGEEMQFEGAAHPAARSVTTQGSLEGTLRPLDDKEIEDGLDSTNLSIDSQSTLAASTASSLGATVTPENFFKPNMSSDEQIQGGPPLPSTQMEEAPEWFSVNPLGIPSKDATTSAEETVPLAEPLVEPKAVYQPLKGNTVKGFASRAFSVLKPSGTKEEFEEWFVSLSDKEKAVYNEQFKAAKKKPRK